MTTYVLMVSQKFPAYHERAGQNTFFPDKIKGKTKIHTIRANFDLWQKRAEKINQGKAMLSVRVWEGLPYKSKQIEIATLFKVAIEKLENPRDFVSANISGEKINWELIAQNDGLSFEDFCEWFRNAKNEPMAVIQFTDFRYSKQQK